MIVKIGPYWKYNKKTKKHIVISDDILENLKENKIPVLFNYQKNIHPKDVLGFLKFIKKDKKYLIFDFISCSPLIDLYLEENFKPTFKIVAFSKILEKNKHNIEKILYYLVQFKFD